uniref:Uncharacterized protein n=1 Tax=Rhizophora mucronata TaxID=61149 RepID=A0A2P2N2Q3_RHIMU
MLLMEFISVILFQIYILHSSHLDNF